MDDALTRWRQQGLVYLWRYTAPKSRNLDGWHFAADHRGRDSLVELLDLQLRAKYPGRVRLAVTPHLSRPVPPNFDAPGIKWASPKAWDVDVRRKFPDDHWSLPFEAKGVATLELGRDQLTEFRDAVAALDPKLGNSWDYAIGGAASDELMWLWPPPGNW